MNNKMDMDKNRVRFIIPFAFLKSKKTDFLAICKSISEISESWADRLWLEYCIGSKECDLYDAIQKSMQFTSAGNQGIGQCYKINPNCKQKHFPKLKAMMKDGSYVELSFEDMGLHIFQAGIGFFWFELMINTHDFEVLLTINNALKEMAYSNPDIKFLTTYYVNENLSIHYEAIRQEIPQKDEEQQYIKIEGKNGGYINRQMLSEEWNKKTDTSFYISENEVWCKYRKEEEFNMAMFVLDHLTPFEDMKYFASRSKTLNDKTICIPDKAILFSVVIENSIEGKELLPNLYWLAKGYVDSYFVPDNFINHASSAVFEPFQDSIWYASMEGCAQIIYKSQNNNRSTFFETTYQKRLEDYFYIYILVLHQYYGLLKLDEDITSLPNSMKGYNKLRARKQLYGYKQDLNFFLMNSVFLKVSHITNHNLYFEYLKHSYNLEQMMSLIMEKVTLMNDMVEHWQQKQKNKKLLGLTITGGIFILIQTFNNILGIYDYFGLSAWISKGVYSIITMLSSILLGFILWMFVKDWRID